MTAKNFILIYGIIILLYGILFLFLTSTAYDLYGMTDQATDMTNVLLKNLGTVFVAAGVMGILARDASASRGRKAILAFIGLGSIIFLIHNILGLASGAPSGTMTIVDMIVQAFFGLGGIYFFMKENTGD